MRIWLLPRLSHVLFAVILGGGLLLGSRMLNTDGDLGRHLTLGTLMLQSRSIPLTDVLSFTRAGSSRPPYEWLSQIAFATAYRLLNLDGVVLLSALTIAAAFVVVYLDAAERSGAPILAMLMTCWAAVASSLHWLTRPHIASFLLLAIWLRALDRLRAGAAVRIWEFPLLMLIWANAHGGFIIGILALAAYIAGWIWQAWRGKAEKALGLKLLVAGVTSLAASVLTPDFWRNWEAVLQNRSLFILSRTAETRILDLSMPGTWPFLGLVIVAVVVLGPFRRSLVPSQAFLLGGLVLLSLGAERNIPLFAIAVAPVLVGLISAPPGLGESWRALERRVQMIEAGLRGLLWPSITVLAVTAIFSYHQHSDRDSFYRFNPVIFPVAAADWIEGHPPAGNMLNDLNWGGYLLYRLWPDQRVFIDSQTDFYGEAFTRQYEGLVTASGSWQSSLTQYEIRWVVLPTSSRLAATLQRESTWAVLYHDPTAIILEKSGLP